MQFVTENHKGKQGGKKEKKQETRGETQGKTYRRHLRHLIPRAWFEEACQGEVP